MVELTRGQKLAFDQLTEIAECSKGALQILGAPEASTSKDYVWFHVSLATGHYASGDGLAFRERERMKLHVHPDFPFVAPSLYFARCRFPGAPHVQWGSFICLFQSSETEYNSSDGMYGFFHRVEDWMVAAGSGQLDPLDAPLHPPVAYASSSRTFVIRADAPAFKSDSSLWVGRVKLNKVRPDRYDVVGWEHLDDWGEPVVGEATDAAVIFDTPLATEFPSTVRGVIGLLRHVGMSVTFLKSLLRLCAHWRAEGEPAHIILGAPMRRKAAGEPLRPHLTVWEIDAEAIEALRGIIFAQEGDAEAEATAEKALETWMDSSKVTWCEVLEDRPEIVNRRDGGTLAADLTGKRVLLLGCGALGSAIGETVVRSGAQHVHLVDVGRVKPGILVRQRFTDTDIGLDKSDALKGHLEALGLSCTVITERSDLGYKALARFDLATFDLVIDATASTRVAQRMEEELKALALPVPLISVAVSARAENGSVAVKMPGFRGGPHNIARLAKLQAFARHRGHALVKAFWPDRDTMPIFQPEPGCSAPTFVGSAADIDHHAAGLLNVGLARVREHGDTDASLDLIAAPWLADSKASESRLGYALTNPTAYIEQNHGYAVLRSDASFADMSAELKRIARTRSDKIETGGLLFGEVDDAHQCIWIDSASGPPPDSQASAEQFLCGTAGTRELAAAKAKASGESSRFIGIWHTHPISRGRPSLDDLNAMLQLLHFQELPPRQVVMLIIGFAATKREENYYLFRRNEFVRIKRLRTKKKAASDEAAAEAPFEEFALGVRPKGRRK